jgi:hypothetical protein
VSDFYSLALLEYANASMSHPALKQALLAISWTPRMASLLRWWDLIETTATCSVGSVSHRRSVIQVLSAVEAAARSLL